MKIDAVVAPVPSLEQALELYRAGKVSPARAAQLAGLNRWKFVDIAKERGITTPYTEEMVKEDFANGRGH
jgi:predicted HTH domain antitoxin